jgi:hypothetical protein
MFSLNTNLSGNARFKISPFYRIPSIYAIFFDKKDLVCLSCDKCSKIYAIPL